MKRILIGSCKMKELYPEFAREPKDVDFATDEECKSSVSYMEYLYNPVLCHYLGDEEIDGDEMLTLKVSHLFYPKDWDKHMWDVQFLLDRGHVVNPNLLNLLRDFWEDYLPKIRRSNLSMTKEDFFTNNVNEDTDQHDYLHTLLNPIPMYTRLLKDGSEVELDERKWHRLTQVEKDAVVFEETAVMAFERYSSMHYKKAFARQLRDNIMKHFPIYIALHAIYNYKELHITNNNFIKTIQNGLKENQRNPEQLVGV